MSQQIAVREKQRGYVQRDEIINMVIDEKKCKDKLYTLKCEDWEPLITLIPKIENTSTFGEWSTGTADEEGIYKLEHCIPMPIVFKFLEVVYAVPIIINFNWSAWDDGRKIASDENFDLDSTDLLTKCKLITAIVRNDRFCEGALISAFESGLILRILKSIEKEVYK